MGSQCVQCLYVCIMDLGTSVTRAPLHTFSTKAACNVSGCKVCVVKTTATFCSNIAHNIAHYILNTHSSNE